MKQLHVFVTGHNPSDVSRRAHASSEN